MKTKLNISLWISLIMASSVISGQGITIQPGARFTVQNGAKLATTGTAGITVKSDATVTGSFLDQNTSSGNVTFNGIQTVQRYIPNDFTWHFLSSPVSAQVIWPEFSPEPTGIPLSFGAGPDYNWDFYYWNPNADTETELYWINLRQDATGSYNSRNVDEPGSNAGFGVAPPAVTIGRGYLTSYKDAWTTGSPETHSFTGALNTGEISRAITKGANSWNLVGNPYPSSVDWQATTGWTRSTLTTSGSGYDYWIYVGSAGNYGVCNSTPGEEGTLGTTRYIAPMQGFFINAASSGTLSMDNSIRVHSIQSWLKGTGDANNMLRLKLTTNANSYNDEMIVKVNPAFEDEGSQKLWSMEQEAPEIYSIKDGVNYSIDRMPSVNETSVVNLGVKAGVSAGYTLTVSGLESFYTAKSVILEDLKTGTIQTLNDNNVYTFSASPDDQANRLKLSFDGPYGIDDGAKANPVTIYSYEKTIVIRSNSTEILKGEVYVYDLVGQTIKHLKVNNNLILIPMDGITGYYVVALLTDNGIYNGKVFLY